MNLGCCPRQALFATRSAAAPIFPSSFLWRLERTFGWRLLFLLWVVQHMMKGLSHSRWSLQPSS